MNTDKTKTMKSIANFLFEAGILSRTPRSGFHFLGSGHQSVAEHVHRTVFVGYALATMEKEVDMEKVMKMCLFHDLAEARTSDLNYVHQKYAESDEKAALNDLADAVPFGADILAIVAEMRERKTKEAILAKDADQLEWILSLKEEIDTGNIRATSWIVAAIKRLKTTSAQKLAKVIMETNSDEWWCVNKEDRWWIDRNGK